MDFWINKYFGLLVKEYNFKGPYNYNYVREAHTDFVKGDLIVKIAYDGDYWVELIKTKKIYPNLENGTQKVTEIAYSELRHYDLSDLDRKRKLWNSISSENFPDKSLWYYFNIIKMNPELLEGNFRKLTLRYDILKRLHLIK